MAKGNGKPDLDLEHELPEGDGRDVPPEGGAPENQSRAAEAGTEEELRKLRSERDALYDRLARLQADFENQRKRIAKEQADYKEYAVADAIKALLPIVDSFDRAIRTTGGAADDFRSGVELINRQLHDALTKLGVQPIDAQGAMFDPRLHEAVQMVETTEVPDHLVIDELQRGYRLKDRLLRPAMVRVASNPTSK